MQRRGSHLHGVGEALCNVTLPFINSTLQIPCDSLTKGCRPVPAPRPSRALLKVQSPSTQSRSCSVPPDNRMFWENCGRELNVDDGLSIRSGSVTSLVSDLVNFVYLYALYVTVCTSLLLY